jgi:hypothetical protein
MVSGALSLGKVYRKMYETIRYGLEESHGSRRLYQGQAIKVKAYGKDHLRDDYGIASTNARTSHPPEHKLQGKMLVRCARRMHYCTNADAIDLEDHSAGVCQS